MTEGVKAALMLGYLGILVYTLLLAYTLFINPYFFKWLLSYIFLIPFLRRWRSRMRKLANQLIITSRMIKGKSATYWIQVSVSTFLSWTARYWVVNFMFMAWFFSTLASSITF